MTVLVGVDGCPGGWLALAQQAAGSLTVFVAPTFVDLIARVPKNALIGVDIPIGLPNIGDRDCDREARQRLGKPRSNSVFSAPIRSCLKARTYEEACRIRHKIEGKKMSRQAFGILKKIDEVDLILKNDPRLARRVIEVHPEVSFAEWNGGRALKFSKRKVEGKNERSLLIDSVWPGVVDGLREQLEGKTYALDDLHDAFAALWSMRRYGSKQQVTLGKTARDSEGLPMRIVA